MTSVVVPVYNGLAFLDELAFRIDNVMSLIKEEYEIIFVEDGCPEYSWNLIEKLSKSNPNIVGVKLLRNFGQHSAIIAGLFEAKGDYVVVMDCDLQDRPEEISPMLLKAKEGFEVVFARRQGRNDGYLKKTGSKIFYFLFSKLTGKRFDRSIGNFGVYSHKAIQSILSLPESNKYLPLTMQWFGYKTAYVNVTHDPRKIGKSNYTFSKLISLAMEMIISFSNRPLIIIIKFGALISLFSFLTSICVIILKFTYNLLLGWSSLILAISFFSGIIIIILGIIGLYISRLVSDSRGRPMFIIEKKTTR